MRYILLLSLVTITLIVSSCRNDDSFKEEICKLQPIASFDCINDSIYFSSIYKIDENYGKIYLVDRNNNRIIVTDEKLRFERIIGNSGRGPGEILGPTNVLINNNIYIVDANNTRINCYDISGTFINSFRIPPTSFPNDRMGIDGFSRIISPTFRGASTPFVAFDTTGEKVLEFGEINNSYFVPNTKMSTRSHIVTNENNDMIILYNSEPIIECFNKEGEKINQTIIEEIPTLGLTVERIKSQIKNNKDRNVKYSFVTDGYYYQNKIYYLTMSNLYVFTIDNNCNINYSITYELQSDESKKGVGWTSLCVFQDTLIVSNFDDIIYVYNLSS